MLQVLGSRQTLMGATPSWHGWDCLFLSALHSTTSRMHIHAHQNQPWFWFASKLSLHALRTLLAQCVRGAPLYPTHLKQTAVIAGINFNRQNWRQAPALMPCAAITKSPCPRTQWPAQHRCSLSGALQLLTNKLTMLMLDTVPIPLGYFFNKQPTFQPMLMQPPLIATPTCCAAIDPLSGICA